LIAGKSFRAKKDPARCPGLLNDSRKLNYGGDDDGDDGGYER
jgi:hypothetical protein